MIDRPILIGQTFGMKDGLYHKDVYLPVIEFAPVYVLTLSLHAKDQIRLKNIPPFPLFFSRTCEVVEIQVVNGVVSKILARRKVSSEWDVCFVFLVREKLIKTVWLNQRDDRHATLDENKYRKEA
jgi:hypothetical protein